jgi:hypothetical protein
MSNFIINGHMGILRVFPIVFSVVLLGLFGLSHEAFAADFGDAPISYGTPSHTNCGPTLGPLCDDEVSSQHSPDADGDDNNGVDDEDGVTFSQFIPRRSSSITLNVNNPGGIISCYNGWIDFNQNGVFDASERLVTNNGDPCGGGTQNINVNVPAGTTPGDTFARFRLQNSFGTLAPTGTVQTGEVEDYKVTILPPCNVAPTLSVPADISREATDPSGTVVNYSPSANDCYGFNIPSAGGTLSCNPSSGSLFSLGDTTVTCTATDIESNQAQDNFLVTIVDTTPPVITISQLVLLTEVAPVVFDLEQFLIDNGFVTDNGDPNPMITNRNQLNTLLKHP